MVEQRGDVVAAQVLGHRCRGLAVPAGVEVQDAVAIEGVQLPFPDTPVERAVVQEQDRGAVSDVVVGEGAVGEWGVVHLACPMMSSSDDFTWGRVATTSVNRASLASRWACDVRSSARPPTAATSAPHTRSASSEQAARMAGRLAGSP